MMIGIGLMIVHRGQIEKYIRTKFIFDQSDSDNQLIFIRSSANDLISTTVRIILVFLVVFISVFPSQTEVNQNMFSFGIPILETIILKIFLIISYYK